MQKILYTLIAWVIRYRIRVNIQIWFWKAREHSVVSPEAIELERKVEKLIRDYAKAREVANGRRTDPDSLRQDGAD